ncbi:DUF262 domain-containing protein [Myxococcota bacterium]|nr:DUF262 domain-containing protein [Myxococcota bacterium]
MSDLFPGEKFELESSSNDASTRIDDDFVNAKYERGDIRIVTEQARYPLTSIVSMLDSGNYELNPEFQRRHRWLNERKSRLIESFIMNVPIPPIFLYEASYSKYEVMDGLQRLTAISEFYRGEYALSGLREWRELNGKHYRDLPEQVRRGIDRRYLSSIILLRETAKNEKEAQFLKQMVFERINSGGEKLEPQESRNALYSGPLNKLCISLAELPSFRRMWGIPEWEDFKIDQSQPVREPEDISPDADEDLSEQSKDNEQQVDDSSHNDGAQPLLNKFEHALRIHPLYRTMGDVELVLRFFAFRQYSNFPEDRLRDYLDFYLKHGNSQFSDELLERLKQLFVSTSDLAYNVLGVHAFYLWRPRVNSRSGWVEFERPTKVVYDPLMWAFSLSLEHGDVLKQRRDDFAAQLKDLYQTHRTAFAGRSTNKSDTVQRRDLILAVIKRVVHG